MADLSKEERAQLLAQHVAKCVVCCEAKHAAGYCINGYMLWEAWLNTPEEAPQYERL